jgi:hypothetical protein
MRGGGISSSAEQGLLRNYHVRVFPRFPFLRRGPPDLATPLLAIFFAINHSISSKLTKWDARIVVKPVANFALARNRAGAC